MPFSVLDSSLVPARLSLSRCSMVSSRETGSLLSCQGTMASKGASGGELDHSWELVSAAGGISEGGRGGHTFRQAVAAGCLLLFLGDGAAVFGNGVLDVDRGVLHGVVRDVVRGGVSRQRRRRRRLLSVRRWWLISMISHWGPGRNGLLSSNVGPLERIRLKGCGLPSAFRS